MEDSNNYKCTIQYKENYVDRCPLGSASTKVDQLISQSA